MIYLRSIVLTETLESAEYPFSVPSIASLERITFHREVTFFAGENGTGKSTLLEGIAAGAKSITVRGRDAATEASLQRSSALAEFLRFEWARRTGAGFFLRAEDFFDYTKEAAGLVNEMADLASDFEERLDGYGRDLAMGAVLGQRQALVRRYGEDLNRRSHGESFLHFFGARFTRPGLYLLDEPDTALSPQSILALLAMMKHMVSEGSQFIIATHSAMLMAFPRAAILSFDAAPIKEVAFDDVQQIRLLREFLGRPDAFLRQL